MDSYGYETTAAINRGCFPVSFKSSLRFIDSLILARDPLSIRCMTHETHDMDCQMQVKSLAHAQCYAPNRVDH